MVTVLILLVAVELTSIGKDAPVQGAGTENLQSLDQGVDFRTGCWSPKRSRRKTCCGPRRGVPQPARTLGRGPAVDDHTRRTRPAHANSVDTLHTSAAQPVGSGYMDPCPQCLTHDPREGSSLHEPASCRPCPRLGALPGRSRPPASRLPRRALPPVAVCRRGGRSQFRSRCGAVEGEAVDDVRAKAGKR